MLLIGIAKKQTLHDVFKKLFSLSNSQYGVDKKIIVDKKNKNRFICETKSGKKMYILLRWKNGNGVAFPAFQIS